MAPASCREMNGGPFPGSSANGWSSSSNSGSTEPHAEAIAKQSIDSNDSWFDLEPRDCSRSDG
jgi:hypothetical protein